MKIRMFTLPNIITLCNLLCGCTALYFCLWRDDLTTVFWLVVAAAVFDFSDGLAARLTGQYSEVGKQLDSLADMVSFGVVPSAVLFRLYGMSDGWPEGILPGIVTASVALFSALRLARFNIDETQTGEFRGLPTPACALFFVSVGWLADNGMLESSRIAILTATVVFSYLMVCPLRMFALKFSSYSWGGNEVRYSFIALSAAAFALWNIASIPFIIIGYVLVSLVISIACGKVPSAASTGNQMPI
ncbi:MAG: CDP-diacylglycerol--serine O-phosphatidyltransferase [Rikenellaceae bacterium]|nr:CDP-diacylglycerol--serine O-phosphatidyltransferase [Rikenellaceae bacterium]